MKRIIIEDKIFELSQIKQLYPAVEVFTGINDEVTQISLEWMDMEAKGRVEVKRYAIFIVFKNNEKISFYYESREKLNIALKNIILK
ncbi:MAG: phosphomannomutase [Sulfurovum sp.]|nr:MAG: phosphomannomutase [Sulfurovum sp.]